MLKKLGTKLGIRVNDGGELPLPVAAMVRYGRGKIILTCIPGLYEGLVKGS